jgi:hypothetical protein
MIVVMRCFEVKKAGYCAWAFPLTGIDQSRVETLQAYQSSNNMRSGTIPGLKDGVTDTVAEEAPVPPSLVAATEQEYATPPMSPRTVMGEAVPVAVTVGLPAAVQVAV